MNLWEPHKDIRPSGSPVTEAYIPSLELRRRGQDFRISKEFNLQEAGEEHIFDTNKSLPCHAGKYV